MKCFKKGRQGTNVSEICIYQSLLFPSFLIIDNINKSSICGLSVPVDVQNGSTSFRIQLFSFINLAGLSSIHRDGTKHLHHTSIMKEPLVQEADRRPPGYPYFKGVSPEYLRLELGS